MRGGWGRQLWLGLLAALLLGGQAVAAGGGLVISPAFQELTIAAGQPHVPYNLQLTNRTGVDQTFRLSVVDFGSLDESGGVAFLGAPASELEHRYGLASWMTLEKDAVTVAAGGSVSIVVTVDNRPSLAPGGHYGAVLATAVTDDGQPAAGARVGIKQVLSSLVLAIKDGGADRRLLLASQSQNGGWWQLPSSVSQRFHNLGNTHVVPRGVTEVKDMLGRVVVRGALNAGSNPILPQSFRHYATPLISIATAWAPGRYAVTTTYRYDGSDKTQTLTTYIWYAGTVIVWLGIGLILVLVIGLIWWLRHQKRR